MVIFVIGFLVASAEAYKIFVINSNYKTPSSLSLYPIYFEYLAFTSLAFIVPWCWRVEGMTRRIRMAVAVSGFTIVYLTLLSWIEWVISDRTYDWVNAFWFTGTHSGLQVVITFALIFGAILWLSNFDNEHQYLAQLTLKDRNKNYFLELKDVVYLESNDNYVTLITSEGQQHLIRQTLSALEEQLDPRQFQRIHRKYIVSVAEITSYQSDPNGGYLLTLQGRYELKMSKGYKDKLQAMIRM